MTLRANRAILLAASLLAVTTVFGVDAAQATPAYAPDRFRTPSGNIACVFAGAAAAVACEINEFIYAAPARPDSCHGTYGDRFSILNDGFPMIGCHTDTIRSESLPVLSYGQSFVRGDITCRSATSAITCTKGSSGHEFVLSREYYLVK